MLQRWRMVFGIAATCVPLAYVLYTGHVWEDYLITFRYSRNLVQGKGLVYNAGERVYGFSSPINVLLPALFDWMLGATSYMPALWLHRLVSIAAFVAAGLTLAGVATRAPSRDRYAPAIFAVLLLLDVKLIAFTVNGQETGFLLLFLAIGFACASRGLADRWPWAAFCWAGLMYTRADGFVYAGILAVIGFAFSAVPRKREALGIAKAGALGALLYSPWLVWAWSYYGTPVPHTVVAKSAPWAVRWNDPVLIVRSVLQQFPDVMVKPFEPIYSHFGGWPYAVYVASLACGLVCSAYCLVRSDDRVGRMASTAFVLTCFYLGFVRWTGAVAPWYLPPASLLGAIVLARAPAVLLEAAGLARRRLAAARTMQAALVTVMAAVFVMTAVQLRIQQREIELGTRARVGTWLREHSRESDSVYLEPLGYIGYYSERRILDWPGLVSPRIVALRHDRKLDQFSIIPELEADWLVLRPPEADRAWAISAVRDRYEPVQVFDALPRLRQYGWIPGIGYLLMDATFVVFHRKG